MELTGQPNEKAFCPHCTVIGKDSWRNSPVCEQGQAVSDLSKWKAEHAARCKNPTFRWMGVSPGKLLYCPCMLHCKNRVVERLLASLYRNLCFRSKSEAKGKVLLAKIQEKLATTHFGFKVIKVNVTYKVYGCVGNHANKLIQAMPSIIPELYDLNDPDEKAESDRTVKIWQLWGRIDNTACRQTTEALRLSPLLKPTKGGGETPFQLMCNEFFALFAETYTFDRLNADHEVKINSNWYIHLAVCHLNEILQAVGSLRDYTQQGFESHNSLMKRVWRRCTNHDGRVGKHRVKQDSLKQIFDWVLLVREGDAEGLSRPMQTNMKRNYEEGNRYYGTVLKHDLTGKDYVVPKGMLLVDLALELECDYPALCRALNTKNGKGGWSSCSGWRVEGAVIDHGDATGKAVYGGSCPEYSKEIKVEGFLSMCEEWGGEEEEDEYEDDLDDEEDEDEDMGAEEDGVEAASAAVAAEALAKALAVYVNTIPSKDMLQKKKMNELKDIAARLNVRAKIGMNAGRKIAWIESIHDERSRRLQLAQPQPQLD